MIADNLTYQRPGGDPYPIYTPGSVAGQQVTIVESAARFGELLLPATDDANPLYDAGAFAGETSSMLVAKVVEAGDATLFGKAGLYAVCQSEDGVLEDGKGFAVTGFATVQALVQVPLAGLAANTPLMPDFSNPGTLVLHDGTAKCVALVARKVNAVSSAGEYLVSVRFNGTYGFA